MQTDLRDARFGRFGETAMWILVALASGPCGAVRLIDQVRELDGNIGPGALFGAVARLERHGLIELVMTGEGRRAYRLAISRRTDQVSSMEGLS